MPQEPDLKRQNLSQSATKYGKAPGSVGVYFRPDVDLLKSTGVHARAITEKGLSFVKAFDERYGDDWVKDVEKTLADKSVSDGTKIKLRIKH